jgi:hypothetical protein
MSGPVTIRSATTDDTGTLFDLLCGIVQDHLPGQRPWTSPEQLRQDGFGVDPLFEALIAKRDSEPVGFITFYRGYASWRGKPMAMIGNLHTVEHARGLWCRPPPAGEPGPHRQGQRLAQARTLHQRG